MSRSLQQMNLDNPKNTPESYTKKINKSARLVKSGLQTRLWKNPIQPPLLLNRNLIILQAAGIIQSL